MALRQKALGGKKHGSIILSSLIIFIVIQENRGTAEKQVPHTIKDCGAAYNDDVNVMRWCTNDREMLKMSKWSIWARMAG